MARVEAAALDDVLGADFSADLVKVDVEGSELDVLHGMENLLNRSSNVALIVECNPVALGRKKAHSCSATGTHPGTWVRGVDHPGDNGNDKAVSERQTLSIRGSVR